MRDLPEVSDIPSTLTFLSLAALEQAGLLAYEKTYAVYLQSVRAALWKDEHVQFDVLVSPLQNHRYIPRERAEPAQTLFYLYLQRHQVPVAISEALESTVRSGLSAIADPEAALTELARRIEKHRELSHSAQEAAASLQSEALVRRQEIPAQVRAAPAVKRPARRPAGPARLRWIYGAAAALVLLVTGGYWTLSLMSARGRLVDVGQFAHVMPLAEARVIDRDHLFVVTLDDEFAKLSRQKQREIGANLLRQVADQGLHSATVQSGGEFFQIYPPELAGGDAP